MHQKVAKGIRTPLINLLFVLILRLLLLLKACVFTLHGLPCLQQAACRHYTIQYMQKHPPQKILAPPPRVRLRPHFSYFAHCKEGHPVIF